MSGHLLRSAAARYLHKLSHGVAGARTGAIEAATMEALSPDHAGTALERAIRLIEKEAGAPLDPASKRELEKLFVEDGKRAIQLLKDQGLEARLDPPAVDALEAIVEVDGSRPTLAFSAEDRIDMEDETLGQWRQVTKKFATQLSAVASSVGRIDLDGKHRGTGFVVTERLVLTNRHVLQALATKEAGAWKFRGQPTITFDANPGRSRRRHFEILKKVVLAGPDAIDPLAVDYNKLDFALLECSVSGDSKLPAPLALESDPDKVAEGRPIFTVGYPAQPKRGVYESELLRRLFRYRYGVKRFSPGEIDRGLGSDADGTGGSVFTHDATTLGGNSGSCVVDLGNDGQLVVGLHFAGDPREANYAHANAQLRSKLADLGLAWKAWIQPS